MPKRFVGIKMEKEDVELIKKAAIEDRRSQSSFIGKAAIDKAKSMINNE